MSDQATARTRPPADSLQALRLLALAAVAAGVGLLAAAAFVLSYPGIHAVALYAGVPPRLARIYPLIFDAMLIVACAAVLSLRGAGLPSRCYAWLSMLGLIVVAAAADTMHATGTRLPHKPTAAVVAIVPWALVLIGFGLLLCMLRQARLRQAAAEEEGLRQPSGQAEVPAGLDALFGPKVPPAVNGSPAPPGPSAPPEPPAAGEPAAEATGTGAAPQSPTAQEPPAQAAGVTAQAEPAADPAADLAIDAEPDQDDPASDEGSAWTREQQPAAVGPGPNGDAAPVFSPAPTTALDEAGTGEPEAKTEPEPRTGPGREAENEPEAAAGPEPEGGPEPEADPAPVLAAASSFDRTRSSPAAPDA
jgi:Protein of unknown function (DUF2637)